MKIQTVDLSKTLKNYKNEWLALNPDSLKVVATGNKPKNVLEDARNKGILSPVLTKAPANYGTYIL
ncbi:MAG: DUF5678 domain-containing protein [Patescibacteria group bacterium]